MNLKKTIAFWERVMTSITFAEANEHQTARQMLEEDKLSDSSRPAESPMRIHAVSLPQE